jgi:hypothetical protein
MAFQITYEVLQGSGQGQTVRVIIEVQGSPGDVTAMSAHVREEICKGMAVDVSRSARTFGVDLQPTHQHIVQGIDTILS